VYRLTDLPERKNKLFLFVLEGSTQKKQDRSLAMAESDPAFGQIVGGKFQGDFVSRQNTDAVASQASRQVGQDNALVFELHAK
jgi:hypothetical protein